MKIQLKTQVGWGEISAIHVYDKRFTPKLFKELLQLSNKEANN